MQLDYAQRSDFTMRLFAQGKLVLFALLIGVAMPCASYAIGPFNFFNRPPKPPVQDVVFDSAFAIDGKLTLSTVRRLKLKSTTSLSFPDVELDVDVTSEVITIQEFEFINGDTTVTVQVAPVLLQQTSIGSKFATGGVATVDDGVNPPAQIPVAINGRILQSNQNYVLTGSILGVLPVNQGGGNAQVQTLRASLTGVTPIP